MRCAHPKYIARRDIMVNCGRCMSCRINRTSQWAQRLMMELPYWEKSCFITLTYDDDHIPPDRSLHVEEMQLFWKRVRKLTGAKLKNYYCGEYGDEFLRCHYHAIVFGVDFAPWEFVSYKNGRKVFTSSLLADCWQHRGFVTVSDVTYQDCAYVAGYVQKKLYGKMAAYYKDHGLVPPFAHASKGLSLDYTYDHCDQLSMNQFVWSNGHKSPLPRYVSGKLGLLDTDEFGHSPMYYKAMEITKQRQQKFYEKHRLDHDVNESWVKWHNADRSAALQKELDLQARYGEVPDEI